MEQNSKKQYSYCGVILRFGKVIASNYTATTYAVSKAQARNNIKFQYKKKFGLTPSAKLDLSGNLMEGGECG